MITNITSVTIGMGHGVLRDRFDATQSTTQQSGNLATVTLRNSPDTAWFQEIHVVENVATRHTTFWRT